jgi:sulfide dehydrogenase [flavocytochrome c] flavoprotein subunit
VVAGAGFGGLNAAKTLKQLAPNLQVTLVERQRQYTRCPGSNRVIAGIDPIDALVHDYDGSAQDLDIAVVRDSIVGVDARQKRVKLQMGSTLPYDRLIVAPGIDFRWDDIEGYSAATSQVVPHAWKGGEQTRLLRSQITSMRQGGTVLIAVPENPYRCPPGPYERASLIAHYLSKHNPRAKVIILDAKTKFSKQPAFNQAWRQLYPGMIEWISLEQEGKIDYIDTRNRVVHTEFNHHSADVLNVIPPQRAGDLARLAGLTDESGWCPVDPLTFESTLQSGIHVIGDACSVAPMPKSAFSAHSQARVCGAASVALLSGEAPALPRLINHCYSFVDPFRAISVTGVYGYQTSGRSLVTLSSGETPPDGDWLREGVFAHDWYELILEETFG